MHIDVVLQGTKVVCSTPSILAPSHVVSLMKQEKERIRKGFMGNLTMPNDTQSGYLLAI